MQDRYTFNQDCFPKPTMRRALGELTNSPRRTLGELTNSPQPRRALGELTNSPRLLEQQSRFMMSSPNQGTPTKDQVAVLSKKSPAITPTHNLKLLTELAAKVAGGNGSSARQTLQFEDVDTRYNSTAICLGSTSSTSSLAPTDKISPHKDHNYPNRGNHQLTDNRNFKIKDEVCDEYKLEPTVTVEEARLETGLGVQDHRRQQSNRSDMPAPLPPLPLESALFVPPVDRGNRKDKSLGLLAEKMLDNYPYIMNGGDTTEVQLDDTAKQLNTERRRIYDIVNVFEAVQIMSRVCKNIYRWHGRTYLLHSLAWLRELGVKLGMQEQYRVAREQEAQHDIENMSPLTSPHTHYSPAMSPMMSPYGSPGMSPYGSPNDPNGTSMGINTQKFLMLFLVIPEPRKLTLDFAAKVIHGPNPNEKAKVTRVRRLYDIANILSALGLIRKVQITEGKTKKPAFEYVGPSVDNIYLTDEQKKNMPSARQKNSLLAVGKNLAQLPDKDEGISNYQHNVSLYPAVAPNYLPSTSSYIPQYGGPMSSTAAAKRGRSLSGDRFASNLQTAGKLVRTHSEPRVTEQPCTSLIELGEVCQRERERLDSESMTSQTSADAEIMASSTEASASQNNENLNYSLNMKPPTPVRPPSRKKVLLQRYYSDSQLQINSIPKPNPTSAHSFINPSSIISPQPQPSSGLNRSPRQHSAFVTPNPRSAPIPSPLALKSSPMTPYNSYSQHKPQSPKQHVPLRSPVTPRDLRNSSILPPTSPVNKYGRGMPCSPMGPVGRSLLSSPASPRSPIDLSLRPSLRHLQHGRSPLASRSLNLPPSPVTSSETSQSPKPLQLLKSNSDSATSPLLRAYLANNKSANSSSLFKPVVPEQSNHITVIGLLGADATPPRTPTANKTHGYDETPPVIETVDDLDGIYRLPSSAASNSVVQSKPESLIKLPSIDNPMDFSRLLSSQPSSNHQSSATLFNSGAPDRN